MQNPTNTSYEQYKEPVNYIGAIFGAIIGGAIVVGIWFAAVYYTRRLNTAY